MGGGLGRGWVGGGVRVVVMEELKFWENSQKKNQGGVGLGGEGFGLGGQGGCE